MSENRSTPRVAESLDDLAVGMEVVLRRGRDIRRIGTVRSVGNGGAMLQLAGDDVRSQSAFSFSIGEWVILADPPAPPAPDWLVPAGTMEALREAWGNHDGDMPCPTYEAARAVLDAATEVER